MSIFSRRKFLTLLGLAPVAAKAVVETAKAESGEILTCEDMDRNFTAVSNVIDHSVRRVKVFNPSDKEQWVTVEQVKSIRFMGPNRTITKINLRPPGTSWPL